MKRLHFTVSELLILFVFSLIISCSKTDTYTVETIDGVRHVDNFDPLWGDEPKVTIEFVKNIGELGERDENYQFYKIKDIARDNDGNFYVLDAGNYRVQKFDKNWNYLATFGRRGQGPAELLNPWSIDLDTGGNIYVFDPGNRRIQIFSPAGKDNGTIRIVDSGTSTNMYVLGSGSILIGLKLIDREGNLIHEFVKPDPSKKAPGSDNNSAMFSVDKNENIYLAYGLKNGIEKHSLDGQIIFRIERDLDYDIKEAEYNLNPDSPGFGRFTQLPVYVSRGIAIDNKGRIWVCTLKKQPKSRDTDNMINEEIYIKELTTAADLLELEIFSTEGILLGRIPLSINAFMMKIFDDRIYFSDFEGVNLYEYKILEK